jgi:hypothetical protein
MSDFQPTFTSQRSRWQEKIKRETAGEEVEYSGPERRYYQRRQLKDRRESIRFELDKDDRRKSTGRRKTDISTDKWV